MKVNFLFFVCVVFCVMGSFYSCSDDECSLKSDSESESETIGRLHNEGLDYVLNAIREKIPRTKAGAKKVIDPDFVKQQCQLFVENKGYSSFPVVTTKSGIEDQSISSVDRLELTLNLSEKQKHYLDKLKSVIAACRPDNVNVLVSRMKVLEGELQQEDDITEQERKLILCAMVTCRYSALYWAENYEKWSVEILGIRVVKRASIKTKVGKEQTVSLRWWEKYGDIVAADGWWAMKGYGETYIIGTAVAEGINGSVEKALASCE